MTSDGNVGGFEPLYDEAGHTDKRIPWDIGGPQPVVEQLVAHGAIKGEVLDPGTGPGYHAIHFASHGYSATGIDASPTAIERAKRNAERAGVQVDFQVADATKLDGFEGRFDTVVDSAFYHVFLNDEAIQMRYAQALHRATRPGARLYMFEFARTTSTACSGPRYPPTTSSECWVPADGASTTSVSPPTRGGFSPRHSRP